MFYYYGTVISEHITEKPDGGIICMDVPIARTGEMQYLARELQLDGEPERIVTVVREPEEVFSPAAMASFEGVCVCDGHPSENVTAENFSMYSKGHVQGIRREGEYVVGDIHISDKSLASDVLCNVKRQISCGYMCTYEPIGDGRYRQKGIRGNHVSVVLNGRAGGTVSIKDSAAQGAEKGRKTVKEFWKTFLAAFAGAAKDASPEELETMVVTTATALDAAPAEKAPEAEPAVDAEPVAQVKEDADSKPENTIDSKLETIMDMLAKMAEKQGEEEKEPHVSDEGDLDKMIANLTGEEKPKVAVTISAEQEKGEELPDAAKETAVEMLKRVRPAVAAIQDRFERARVTDALLAAVKNSNVMGDIVRAAQDSAQKAADRSKKTNYETVCAEAQAAYDARNPHKNKKED